MNKQSHIMYIAHGGGPLPLLGDPNHQEMIDTLNCMATQVGKPSAILVISAHWEASVPTITASVKPELIYDYGGFPAEAYEIRYPSFGQPDLANKIYRALTNAGIEAALDEHRGFDHGMFVPLKIMFPEADIPVVQLSLVHTLDAQAHLEIGKALQALDVDNLLVIGSGFSYHNMRTFFNADGEMANRKNIAFDNWLKETVTDTELSEDDRYKRLAQWDEAPDGRFCHPREEHLLPLHVCYGMAGKASDGYFTAVVMNKKASMFSWQV
ncbi:DODA-type extradiol aromatic ring-opening family dioxygenase [Reinekea sp.]|jgi:4,5-DOPA dioxygenase extradiol|uniref:DODA-type extradiol aromatic ring-opening family dioxygenase n=1 Tax=Reinekea sp. TaxID=1970455 RepID=UPI0039893C5B